MPLLLAYRRWWFLVFMAVLTLPTLGLLLPDLPGPVRAVVAPEENWWTRATQKLDPFINNNFGFRGAVMAANASYARATDSTRARPVLMGEGRQLFYTGDLTLEQSLGLVFRTEPMAALVQTLERLKQKLEAGGARLVVTVPPNAATMMPERLPDWARAQMRKPTELDWLAGELPKRDIRFVDLRPILAAEMTQGPLFRRSDTHWTQKGAILAFNAAMVAAGRADLAVPLDEAMGPVVPVPSGDLARYLGEADPVGDLDYDVRNPAPQGQLTPLTGIMPARPDSDPFKPHAFATGHGGPSILVIGDSFTQHYWTRLLAARTSRFAWMHHSYCRFEMDAIDRFKPDIVIYIPTERSIACKPQKGPAS